MDNLEFYQNNGYIILENIFNEKEINIFRDEVLSYIKNNKTMTNSEGITIPDFIKYPEFNNLSKIKDLDRGGGKINCLVNYFLNFIYIFKQK